MQSPASSLVSGRQDALAWEPCTVQGIGYIVCGIGCTLQHILYYTGLGAMHARPYGPGLNTVYKPKALFIRPRGVLCRAAAPDQDPHGHHGAPAGGRPTLRRRGHAQAGEPKSPEP